MATHPQLVLLVVFAVLLIMISLNSYVTALNLGVQAADGLSLSTECSRTCESKFCGVAPFLRYGKYCGILYSGCPGEKPCDALDACCMQHDDCIGQNGNNYLNEECNKNLLGCATRVKKSKAPTFKGNTCSVDEVADVIIDVAKAAIIAGKIVKSP
nr:phospholipase A2-alpha-like [Ipomoea trifida]